MVRSFKQVSSTRKFSLNSHSDDEYLEEGSAGGEIKTDDSVDSVQKAGFGASLGCKWDVFFENSEFFGCISWWWVLCFALIFGTIIGCWIPRCYR